MGKMNFTQFQEYVKEHFIRLLPEENRESVSISIVPSLKTNCALTGFVAKPVNKSFAPTIYLDEHYKDYESGENLDIIVSRIYEIWVKHINDPENFEINEFINKFKDFNLIKSSIIANVINKERNKEMLSTIPHKVFEDLAIIYKILVNTGSDEIATVTIQNSHLLGWSINQEDAADVLYDLAIENTKKISPCAIQTMDEVLSGMMNLSLAEIKVLLGETPFERQMFVLTNQAKTNGAIAMFFEDVLEELADKLNSNLYIMPSSIHDCIVVSSNTHVPSVLKRMVTEVNATALSPEEYLSDSVYYFDKETKALSIIE